MLHFHGVVHVWYLIWFLFWFLFRYCWLLASMQNTDLCTL